MTRAYYNEIDPAAAHLLRCLIEDGVIAPGDVDERSIKDVQPEDLNGYTQCHFFAGGGLWSVAARLAGWPDDRELWSGSCPCQSFSVAGKGLGTSDPRHLWPDFFRLIRSCRPPIVLGEQVAGKAGYGWLDGVRSDLASEDYASRGVDIPACSIDAPHFRQRLYWVAVDDTMRGRHGHEKKQIRAGRVSSKFSGGADCNMETATSCGSEGEYFARGDEPRASSLAHGASRIDMADAAREREPSGSIECASNGGGGLLLAGADQWRDSFHSGVTLRSDMADADRGGCGGRSEDAQRGEEWGASPEWSRRNGTFWSDYEWRVGADNKARRVGSDVCVLVDGFSPFLATHGLEGFRHLQGETLKHAADTQTLAGQILRALWEDVQSQPPSFWGMGKQWGISAQEILLTYLRQYSHFSGETGLTCEGSEDEEGRMRVVRQYPLLACSSLRREPSEQFARQHPDALRALSRVLAQHAGEAWEAHTRANAAPLHLLVNGFPNRVSALRIAGNAIVPELAAEVIAALMETLNDE